MHKTTDILIAGAGIMGLAAAKQLLNRGLRITVVEKEATVGFHASGRNSGVLHAGIYYHEESLKAKLCLRGNELLSAWLVEQNLPFRRSGKLIGAFEEAECGDLQKLFVQAQKNGTPVQWLTKQEAEKMALGVQFCGDVLYSPQTGLFDPLTTMHALQRELAVAGVQFVFGARVKAGSGPQEALIARDNGARDLVGFGRLLNCTGAWADQVAHDWQVGKKYRMLPFRGSYHELGGNWPARTKVPVYPVPDPNLPFLGVHLTPTLDGHLLAGPNAFPALGRSHYHGASGIRPREALRTMLIMAGQLMSNRNRLRNHVLSELGRQSTTGRLAALRRMIPDLNGNLVSRSEHCGIRAQLYDHQNRSLVMDFLVEEGPHSLHVLNAVSPAFTSSFAFAEWLDNQKLLTG